MTLAVSDLFCFCLLLHKYLEPRKVADRCLKQGAQEEGVQCDASVLPGQEQITYVRAEGGEPLVSAVPPKDSFIREAGARYSTVHTPVGMSIVARHSSFVARFTSMNFGLTRLTAL